MKRNTPTINLLTKKSYSHDSINNVFIAIYCIYLLYREFFYLMTNQPAKKKKNLSTMSFAKAVDVSENCK